MISKIANFAANVLGLTRRTEPVAPRNPYNDVVRLISPQPIATILDVGANEGQTAEQCLKMFPDARIICFEPFASACEVIRRKFAAQARLEVVEAAVTDSDGSVELKTYPKSYNNSLFRPAATEKDASLGSEDFTVIGSVTVRTVTLDHFCRDNRIDHVDILKIDVQGAESLAFKGMRAMLAGGKIDIVLTEILCVPLYEGQCYYDELFGFLHGYGYRLLGLYNERYSNRGNLMWADALFAAPHVLKRGGF